MLGEMCDPKTTAFPKRVFCLVNSKNAVCLKAAPSCEFRKHYSLMSLDFDSIITVYFYGCFWQHHDSISYHKQ